MRTFFFYGPSGMYLGDEVHPARLAHEVARRARAQGEVVSTQALSTQQAREAAARLERRAVDGTAVLA